MDIYNREELIILLTDAHQFVRISLELGLDNGYPHFIQEYYETSGEAVVSRGGWIIKYIGDALFAVFNPGNAVQAVEAALEMRAEYYRLLKKYRVKSESELEVGIGAGPVVTGTFGHFSLRTRDVFGSVVNETAMIMHYLGIAVTKEIHQQIGSAFKTRRLEDIRLKWAEIPLEVWAIVEE